MKAATRKFVIWLMGLTRIMRYFVIAVLVHVLLAVVLGSITIVAYLPKIIASFDTTPLPPPSEKELDPFAALRDFEYNGPTVGGGGGTKGKGPGGVPTAGTTPPQYKAGIDAAEARGEEPKVSEIIGVVSDAASAIARPQGGPTGVNAPVTGMGDLKVGSPGIAGPGGGGFRQRMGPMRAQALQKFKGGADTEKAVLAALRWLKNNQRADGSWKCRERDEAAGTALAMLAFLGHGETPDSEEFGTTVHKALQYLVSKIDANGLVAGQNMYAQGIVTLSLSEAYGMTQAPAVRDTLERALNAITTIQKVKKKDPSFAGGWRYKPTDDESDTSVSGWMIMALKSAKLAGVTVPEDAFQMASAYLWQMYGDGGFGYKAAGREVGPTAIGVLCQQFMGHGDDKRIKKSLEFLKEQKADWNNTKLAYVLYDWYYATQAMFQAGGSYWEYWNYQIRETMVKSQSDDGHWPIPPQSEWERKLVGDSSPVYSTALGCLILEVYYRYLPTYQQQENTPAATSPEP